MAWTTPATAVTGDVIPAAFWNVNGRDDLNALHDVLSGAAQAFGDVLYPTSDTAFYLQDAAASGVGGALLALDSGDYLLFTRADNVFRFRVAGVDKATISSAGDFGITGSINAPGDVTAGNTGGSFGRLVAGGDMGANPPPATANGRVYIGYNYSNGGLDGTFFINDSGSFLVYNNFGGPQKILEVGGDGAVRGKGFFDSGQVAVGPATNVNIAHGRGARPRILFGYYSVTINLVSNNTSNVSVMPPSTTTTSVSILAADSVNIVLQNASASTTFYCRIFAML